MLLDCLFNDLSTMQKKEHWPDRHKNGRPKKKYINKKGRYRKQRLINNRLSPVLSNFCFQNNCLFVVTEILPVVGTSEISEFMLNIIRFLKDCIWYLRGNNWNLVSGLINDWLCINQSFDTLCTIKVHFILSCTSIRLCLIIGDPSASTKGVFIWHKNSYVSRFAPTIYF